jgi:hypothetical protein
LVWRFACLPEFITNAAVTAGDVTTALEVLGAEVLGAET